ncbi:MAG: DUF4347 domain-containing protein [Gammaproteobacteria bacterium]|nr:DUF4347 domain-containing protein [Gammaproteobacteria bacterium]
MNTTLTSNPSGLSNFALIDSNLPDLATLCAGLPSDCGIIWFDGALQGIDAIAQQFNQHAAIDRLHVITHGAPGKLFFGNTTLSQDSLADHADAIEQISQALSASAELYVYACELAQGVAGQAFVQALSEQIGLPIAAATHKVGHSELGGSWELDAVPMVMSGALEVSEWRGVLALEYYSATLSAGKIVLTFNEALGITLPEASAFTVLVNGTSRNVTVVEVGSSSAKLNLTIDGAPIDSDDYITVAYTAPESNDATGNAAIQDANGVDAESIATSYVINTPIVVTTAQTETRVFTDNDVNASERAVMLVSTGSLIVATDGNSNTADAIQAEYLELGIQSGSTVSAADYAIEIDGNDSALPNTIINYGTLSAGNNSGTAIKTLVGATTLVNAGSITGNVVLDNDGNDVVSIVRTGTIDGTVDAGTGTGDDDVLELHSSSDYLLNNKIDNTEVGAVTDDAWNFDLSTVGAAGTYRNFEQLWTYDTSVTLYGAGDTGVALDISSGGTLKVGDTLVDGTVTAGVGTLQTKDLTLEYSGTADSTLVFDLNGGSTAGTDYDQISVTGAVTAGGALTINLGDSFTAAVNDKFTLIANDDTDAVIGTFTDLIEEGAEIVSGDYTFTISYAGGTGNDVELTVTEAPVSLVVTNANDTGAGSLRDILALAQSGDTITFDASFTANQTITLASDLTVADGVNIDFTNATGLTIAKTTSEDIVFSGASTLTVDTTKTVVISAGIEGNGTLTKAGAGTLELADITNATDFTGTLQLYGGKLTGSIAGHIPSTGTIKFNGGNLDFKQSNPADYTSINLNNAIVMEGAGTITNTKGSVMVLGAVSGDGTLTFVGPMQTRLINTSNKDTFTGDIIIDGLTLTTTQLGNPQAPTQVGSADALGTGTITLKNGGGLNIYPQSGVTFTISNDIIVEGSGSLSLDGVGTAILEGDLLGSGTLSFPTTRGVYVINGSNNTFTGDVSIYGTFMNSTVRIDSALTANVVVGDKGLLAGIGTITGNVTVNGSSDTAFGKIDAGTTTTAGTLTINGNLTLNDNAVLGAQIGGTTAGTDYDQIIVNGAVDVTNALLSAAAINDFVPSEGNSFVLISNNESDAVTGTFSGVTATVGGVGLSASYEGGTNSNDFTLSLAPSGLSGVTTSHTFTETELQTTPQLLDSDVTFSYDNTKLTNDYTEQNGASNYATLYVNYVQIVPDGDTNNANYDEVNDTYYNPNSPSSYTEYVSNNVLSLKTDEVLQLNGDDEVVYNNNVIGTLYNGGSGFEITFDKASPATAEAIDKIIESITLSVNDYPEEQSKFRIVLKDNTGDTTDPVYVDVALTAENDAPVLSTPVGLKTVNMLSDGYEYAYSVATLSDGSIIVAGVAFGDPDPDDETEVNSFTVLTKYAADGTLDTTFGTNGVVTVAPAEDFDNPQIVIDSNGNIVVAAIYGDGTNQSIGVMRFDDEGRPFSTSGTYRLPTSDTFLQGNPKIAINDMNEIFVTYPYQDANDEQTDFAVVKFDPYGLVTMGWQDQGAKYIDMGTSTFDEVNDIAISNSAVIYLVGNVDDADGNTSIGVARVFEGGDPSWKTVTSVTNGDVWSAIGAEVEANAVAIQSDGKIVVAGRVDGEGSNNALLLARYNTDGTLDTDNFGTGGKVVFTLMEEAGDVVIDSNGKILVLSDDGDMKVARFNADGDPDTTFGVNGVAEVTSGDGVRGFALELATDGTIWIVGYTRGDDREFAIAKLSANGIPNADFGNKASYTTYGDPIVLDGGISVFDGELSDDENEDYYFIGATLTIQRQGTADPLDIFSAAEGSDLTLFDGIVEYDGDEVGTYTNAGGQLSITFTNSDADSGMVNDVMRNIAYQYGDDTVENSTDINLVWKFNDGNTGADGRTDQGSGGAKETTLVQTLNIAIGEPEPVSSVTLNVNNPFTTNVLTDTTAITITAPEGINITDAANSAVSGLPKNVKMPLGQFAFTLEGVEVGGTVEMSMTADADFEQFSYFKKNLVTNKWVNIAEGTTINEDGTATVKFSLTDGGVYDADRTANGVIVDPGGVGENALLPMILENTTEVGNISLLDNTLATGTLSYEITGGADAAKFSINATTGLLSFTSAPDYEHPTDLGDTAANNTYAVQVTVTGSTSGTEVQNLVVTVLNVAEDGDNLNTAPVIVGLRAEAQEVTAGTAAALDDIRVVDADSDTMTITLTATNGTIGGLTDADLEAEGIQLTGNAATINTVLAAATFTATAAGAASINVSVVDAPSEGHGTSITTTGVYAITAAAAPSSGGGTTPQPDPEPPVTPPVTPPTTTTVDGATVTTGTTTTSDGRTLDVVTITPVTADRQESTGDAGRADIALYYGDSGSTIPATTASLPTGVGLTATGARTPANNAEALDNLIQLVRDTAGNEEAQKNNMFNGGESFLARLEQQADKGPLIVNSIKLTVAEGQTSKPDQPITITGSSDRVAQGSGSGNGGAPVEAIVIDTRDLPPGTVLELKNVEFAVIVGDNVTVTGGDGANIVYAGSGSQTIILGEDDDELFGGDGDDIIGSRGGDDKLHGDAGNDIIVGGIGSDALYGGDGNDILQGGSSDAGTWSFSLLENRQLKMSFASSDIRLADTQGHDSIGTWSGQQVSDTRIAFVFEDYQKVFDIALLYQSVINQLPDLTSMNYWATQNLSSLALAQIAYNTYVQQQSLLPEQLEEKVTTLIQNILGATPDGLVQEGVEFISNGGTWAEAMLYLARSTKQTNAQGEFKLTQDFTISETGWSTNSGNDQLFGGAGNDRLIGGSGNNLLDGGEGLDLVMFVGRIEDYQIGLKETASNEIELVLKHMLTGDENVLRNIEAGSIGGEFVIAKEGGMNLTLNEFQPLMEQLQVIGFNQAQGMGLYVE